MATVFETRLIGNIGKDATIKNIGNGVIAINFPVAHNKNWKDKQTKDQRTKTTWINCTIWKREGSNMQISNYLKKGTLVELLGTPFAKSYQQEGGSIRSEIRLNVSKTNILKTSTISSPTSDEDYGLDEEDDDNYDDSMSDFTLDEDDF